MAKGPVSANLPATMGSEADRWRLSPRQLMDYALAAYHNAQSLLRDAQLLAERRRFGRAAALAVIGTEEIGKAVVLVMAGMGKLKPEMLPGVLKSLRYGRDSHGNKQAVSLVPRLIGEILTVIRPLARRVAGAMERDMPEVASLRGALSHAARAVSPEVLAELQRRLPDEALFNEEVANVMRGAWQHVRDAGLYADFVNGQVSEPSSIPRRVASQHIRSLRGALTGLKPLIGIASMPAEALDVISGATPTFDEPALLEELWEDATRRRKRLASVRKKRRTAT